MRELNFWINIVWGQKGKEPDPPPPQKKTTCTQITALYDRTQYEAEQSSDVVECMTMRCDRCVCVCVCVCDRFGYEFQVLYYVTQAIDLDIAARFGICVWI